MLGLRRALLPQPSPLRVRHRVVAEGVFTGAGKLRSHRDYVRKPVLHVMQLGSLDKPLPIQVWEV